MSNPLSLEHITEMMAELRAYQSRTVVVKIGGNSIAEDELFLSKVARQLVFLSTNGVRIVLVHGGGPQIDDALRDKKIETVKGKDGRRITSPRAMKVVESVMKKMNLLVASALIEAGCKKDKLLLAAKQIRPWVQAIGLDDSDPDNRSGKPNGVTTHAIDRALDEGKIVVLHSLGLGADNKTLYNINGDDYAMAIAIAIKAKRLILVTNVEGVLDENRARIPVIDRTLAKQLIDDNIITGGMVPKVESALWVVRQGVNGVAIIDGFRPWAILAELLTHEGLGTLFRSGV
ncbi:MAG: acetylglutamate kinase [Alphaproteobacteria bacterium]|nr:acetylglutamate kinase [Alphaproteobacteria bacterium]